MSGQAGGRGYLIQAVITVLDALNDRDWTECILEPNLGQEKIDLLLRSAGGDRVSQIKSSENAIGAAQVRAWAASLEAAYPNATRHELRLVGPVTAGAASTSTVGRVAVPVPEALNMRALLEQCAHRLDRYLRDLGHGATRPTARELLAQALATRLGTLAATSKSLSREAIENLLAAWVAELLPPGASDELNVPRQLPGAPRDFVGRIYELAVLRKAAAGNRVRVVVIRGMTGVGKSVLAACAAAEVEQHYPDGQVYLQTRAPDLGSRPTARLLTDVIQAFRATYPSSDDAHRCLADFRTVLNGRRVLILAENIDSAEQAEMLIPPTSGSLLIVTTQLRFDLPGAVMLELDAMSEDDGRTLVQAIAPRIGDGATALARICGYLPLAIRIACGTLNARPDVSPIEYIERLRGVNEQAKLVRAALDVSLAHASAEMKSFLTAMAVFPSDFDAAGAAAVWGEPDEVSDAQLAAVIGCHLIVWDDRQQRYSLHNLVRAYLADRAQVAQFSLFTTRHAHYYSDLCSEIERLYREGGQSVFAALNLFDSESLNIAAGLFFSAEHAPADVSAAEICTTFVRGLTHVMDLRLPPLARAHVLLAGLEAARKLGDGGLIVLHTGNLGRIHRELGELDLAIKCQEWVLLKAIEAGHLQDQAYAHYHIGLAMLDRDDFVAAISHLKRALELSRDPSLGLKQFEASTLNNLGMAYLRMGCPSMAINYLRPALDLQRQLSDPRMLAFALMYLGTALVKSSTETALAVELLESAAGIAEDLGDTQLRFSALQSLVNALEQTGRLQDAFAIAKAQHADAIGIGYLGQEADALRTLGDLHLKNDDVASARATYEELMRIARDHDDKPTERNALAGLANLALHEGNSETAASLLEQQLSLATSSREKAAISIKLGNLLAAEGNRERASTLLGQALQYYNSIDHESVDALRTHIATIEAMK